jgi:uncharacterized protein (TIGR03435 family)
MKRLRSRTGFGRGISLAMAAGILFSGAAAVLAQAVTSAAAAPPVGADGKPLTFDVVSIREDKSAPAAQNPVQNGPTPDGYRVKGLPLIAVIQAAYIPSQGAANFGPNQLTDVPAWLYSIRYDISAKVSEADLPNWKDPALRPAMRRAMLQAMLADRFKLAVQRETKEIPIYELTVARNGPKFKPSEATALADIQQKHPDAAVTLNAGTIVATGPNPGRQWLFGVTMPFLSTFLSNMAGRPIHDKTGLTGKYDITYQLELPPPQQEGADMAVAPDFFSSQIFTIVQDQLGLRLRAAKGLVESLVIDHVERPSEN